MKVLKSSVMAGGFSLLKSIVGNAKPYSGTFMSMARESYIIRNYLDDIKPYKKMLCGGISHEDDLKAAKEYFIKTLREGNYGWKIVGEINWQKTNFKYV